MSICIRCGAKLEKNLSQCKGCGHFNVLGEKLESQGVWLDQIPREEQARLTSGPWDWTFGGGLFPDTLVLLGGVPGAGKSTLVLQILDSWGQKYPTGHPVYITTEESHSAIASRADRLDVKSKIKLYTGADIANSIAFGEGHSLIVLDSLQGLCGDNNDAQHETLSVLKETAMKHRVPVIVTNHITKDELLAGRMTIQHLVDVTCMLYNDEDIRTLVALKSRIGPAFQETMFAMTEFGLSRIKLSKTAIVDKSK